MGYTRYWERTEKPITDDFIKEVEEIIIDSAKKGITICGWDGTGKPILNLTRIALNGNANADKDLSHESFIIDDEIGFHFCKTARKPYDYTVRKVLGLAKKYGLVTKVSSDGANNKICSDKEYILNLVKEELLKDVIETDSLLKNLIKKGE